METSWRKKWFDYVKEVRTKQSKKLKKQLTHREAMAIASKEWPNRKLKMQKRLARIQRKKTKCEAKKSDETDQ